MENETSTVGSDKRPSLISTFTRKSAQFSSHFDLGDLNYMTPLNYFLEAYYGQSLDCYIYHKEILTDANSKNYIFILKSDILLTKSFEDNTNTGNLNYVKADPIILKIDYKSVRHMTYV
jgi:hypothetical protein